MCSHAVKSNSFESIIMKSTNLFSLSRPHTGFRLNKYCGEHLIIANESPISDPTPPTHQLRSVRDKKKSLTSNTLELADDDAEVFDHPIAEALIQNEQTFHHLKILKSSPQDEAYERQLAAAAEAKMDRQNPRKKVYSQVCGSRSKVHFFILFAKNNYQLKMFSGVHASTYLLMNGKIKKN